MQLPKVNASEIDLLHKEIEAQGDLLDQERLDRKTEVDHLRMELHALKETLSQLVERFDEIYKGSYARLLQNFDPEADRPIARGAKEDEKESA